MEAWFTCLNQIIPLNDELTARLLRCMTLERHLKNKALLKQTDAGDWMAFVESGTLEMAIENSEGKEQILRFYQTGDMLFPAAWWKPLSNRAISLFTLTETTLRKIRKTELLLLCSKFPDFYEHYIHFLLNEYLHLVKYNFLQIEPARVKLTMLKQDFTSLFENRAIKDYHLASYCGMDKVTFSRLRGGAAK
ncbi:MAG: Crp/Fnr family transcriptional regulator [Chitinophagaceae bacterium]|uniref:Crp/Fnr family transcriptional regulator n=1 Tax=Microcystis sp. M57BS1 TaxID=2771200 RepID=UPI002590A7DB|nr:Crp/Fnr family transcriptional regulator [Microcystis sp. M57BS1]MCA2536362.1 Crp/Fnr family transcriptional regulator [Microcystis sp. M57BS1]MCA6438814.1 Crp/Fnr family transcriptional regulator [Chitinophagaceae bacterium]MCA6455270.1 Crp/Fnr family transcriptional regulator [Chitinophagaceae bacterium]